MTLNFWYSLNITQDLIHSWNSVVWFQPSFTNIVISMFSSNLIVGFWMRHYTKLACHEHMPIISKPWKTLTLLIAISDCWISTMLHPYEHLWIFPLDLRISFPIKCITFEKWWNQAEIGFDQNLAKSPNHMSHLSLESLY